MAEKPVIQVKNLSVQSGGKEILKNVSFDVKPKCLTAIIGPSGCGKTTLLRSLNRLSDLWEELHVTGEIRVSGQNILDKKTDIIEVRKKIGLLAQKPYVLPMSIYDNVAYGPRIHGIKNKKELDERVKTILDKVGLMEEVKERLYQPASELSVGQQQRLCLARALAVNPEVILCDEPTSALDVISAQKVEKELQELKEEHTIVLVTHTLRQAKRLADYVIFLYMGELVEQGPASQFFNNPKQQKTREYLEGDIS